MTQTLRTDRLLLRPFRDSDGPAYAEIRQKPGVTRYLPSHSEDPEDTRARALQTMATFQACWARDGYGPWAMEHQGQLVGHLGLRRLPEIDNQTELLFLLDPDVQGRGLVTEGGRTALDWGFNHLGLDKIAAFAMPENTASCRVLDRVGMVRQPAPIHVFGLDAVHYIATRYPAG